MKHPLLVIAGGLALLSGAALFAVAHPPRWMVVAAIDLAIAGVTLFGAFKVGRGQAVRLAVAALVPAFIVSALGGLSELEDSSAPLDWVGEVKFHRGTGR